MTLHDRRSALKLVAAGLAAPALLSRPVRAAAPLAELTLWGPPAGPSITLAHAAARGLLADVAAKVTFRAWRNPDEMRAGLTSGTMQTVVMPTTTAANLFNRGLGVRLVNVMTDGLLYVVSTDAGIDGIAALKGRKIAVPFKNDTPEFVLNRLLRAHGLAPGRDLTVETTGTPVEAIQMLIFGRVDAALVPEPAGTAAIIRAGTFGRTVHRVIDIQALWGRETGKGNSVPQAGLAVTDRFRTEHPDLVARLHAGLARATEAVKANPAAAAADGAAALDFPAAIVEKSIAFSNLVCRRAGEARGALEAMFSTVSDANPAIIGGRLPGDDFYL